MRDSSSSLHTTHSRAGILPASRFPYCASPIFAIHFRLKDISLCLGFSEQGQVSERSPPLSLSCCTVLWPSALLDSKNGLRMAFMLEVERWPLTNGYGWSGWGGAAIVVMPAINTQSTRCWWSAANSSLNTGGGGLNTCFFPGSWLPVGPCWYIPWWFVVFFPWAFQQVCHAGWTKVHVSLANHVEPWPLNDAFTVANAVTLLAFYYRSMTRSWCYGLHYSVWLLLTRTGVGAALFPWSWFSVSHITPSLEIQNPSRSSKGSKWSHTLCGS